MGTRRTRILKIKKRNAIFLGPMMRKEDLENRKVGQNGQKQNMSLCKGVTQPGSEDGNERNKRRLEVKITGNCGKPMF